MIRICRNRSRTGNKHFKEGPHDDSYFHVILYNRRVNAWQNAKLLGSFLSTRKGDHTVKHDIDP